MTIGNTLRDLRIDRGLTQADLALALQISRSALALYETAKRDIPNYLICAIAKYFNVSTDYLFGLED